MQGVEQLFKKTVDEIEKMLNTKTVVGEPITVNGNTLIPLVSIGFGFGAGGGTGKDPKKGAGEGGGTGGGGGVKPVAVIVVGPDGVRLDSVKGGAASVIDKAIDTIGTAVNQRKGGETPSSS